MNIFKQIKMNGRKLSSLPLTLLLASGLLQTGCTENNPTESAPTESSLNIELSSNADKDLASLASEAVEKAQTQYSASEQAGYAWAKARLTLDEATTALEAGNFEAAITEADQSTRLTRISLRQANAEQSAWQDRFPKVAVSAETSPDSESSSENSGAPQQ